MRTRSGPDFPPKPSPLRVNEEIGEPPVEQTSENLGWERPKDPNPGDLFRVEEPQYPDQERFLNENPGLFYRDSEGRLSVHRVIATAYSKNLHGGKVRPDHIARLQSGALNIYDVIRGVGTPQNGFELYREAACAEQETSQETGMPNESIPKDKPETNKEELDLSDFEKLPEPKLLTHEKVPEQKLLTHEPETTVSAEERREQVAAKLDRHDLSSPTIHLKNPEERNTNFLGKEGMKIIAAEDAVRPEKESMQKAEEAYLARYKEFHAKKKFYNINEPEDLRHLKTTYDIARLAYADKLQESASQRLLVRADSLGPKRSEEIMRRYNGLMRYREIAKPAAEKKLLARYEALDSRKKGAFSKLLLKVSEANRKLDEKVGTNKARIYRAAASATIVTTGAAAAGVLGTIGVMGAIGYGSLRFGRGLASVFAGAVAGEGAAQLSDRVKQRALVKEKVSFEKDRRQADGMSLEDLEALDSRQTKIAVGTDERHRQKRKNIVRALTAFGVGAGTAAALSELSSVQETASSDTGGSDTTPAEEKGRLRDTVNEFERTKQGPGAQEMATQQPSSTPDTAPATAEAPHTGIEGRLEAGDGANELLYELHEGLERQYGAGFENAPAYVQAFANGNTMEEWSREFGFITEDGSVLVHPDASLSFNGNGELMFNDGGGRSIKLMNADGSPHNAGIEEVKGLRHWHIGDTDAQATERNGRVVEPQPQTAQDSSAQAPTGDEPLSQPINEAKQIESPINYHAPEISSSPNLDAPIGTPLENRMYSNNAGDPIDIPTPTSEIVTEPSAGASPAASDGPIGTPLENRLDSVPQPEVQPLAATIHPIQGNSQLAYLSLENKALAREIATKYALEHPGTKIVFDNPKQGFISFFDRPRVSSVAMNPETGRVVFTEQEIDAQGKPLTAVDRNVLGDPTRFA